VLVAIMSDENLHGVSCTPAVPISNAARRRL
jgi:hypothetical protein